MTHDNRRTAQAPKLRARSVRGAPQAPRQWAAATWRRRRRHAACVFAVVRTAVSRSRDTSRWPAQLVVDTIASSRTTYAEQTALWAADEAQARGRALAA
jgi:hypothetical protein